MSEHQFNSSSLPTAHHDVTIGDLIGYLWHYRVRLCSIMVISCALAVYYLGAFTQNTYQAMTTVRLDPQNINVVDVEQIHEQFSVDAYLLNTELRVMKSPKILRNVIDKLELHKDPDFISEAGSGFSIGALRNLILGSGETKAPTDLAQTELMEALRAILDVKLIRETYIIEIWAETISPDLSVKIANAMADSYIKHQRDEKIDSAAEAAHWLENELRVLSSDLLTVDRKIAMRRAILESTSEVELQENADQIRQMRLRLADLRAQRDALKVQPPPQEGAELAESDIKAILETAETVLGPMEAPSDVERYEAILPPLQRLARIDFLDTQIESLERTLHGLTERISTRAADLNRLKELERAQSNTEALHEKFSNRLRETALQSGLLRPDARLLDYAKRPNQPSGPRWLRTIFFIISAGTILASMLIILWNLIEPVIRSTQDWKRLNTVPILAELPKLRTSPWQQPLPWWPATASDSKFYLTELRTKLMRRFAKPHGVIMVTGCGIRSDHTTLAAQLAETFSTLPNRHVLLIDFDLQNRTLSQQLVPSQNSLSLQGMLTIPEHEWSEAFTQISETSSNPNLNYLPADKTHGLPLDIVADTQLPNLLEHCRSRYDWIIACLPVAEQGEIVALTAELGDHTLYAVDNGSPQRAVVSSLGNLMINSDIALSPILMNMRGLKRPKNQRLSNFKLKRLQA
ncbi:GumC family protein [Epibacterium ulvae]|uniref:GumC family protein n=1 Tax=Epibacterium ulvae TaxID=1156985 RepID=UPI00248FA851|nr:Wzz/FepE/Etk N-terminal domain-containing protein [Epibacterium ulvae]